MWSRSWRKRLPRRASCAPSAPRTARSPRFEKANLNALRIQMKGLRRNSRVGPIVDVLGAAGIAVTLWVGGMDIVSGRGKIEDLITFVLYVSNLANSVNSIGALRGSWEEMMGAADRLFAEVLDVQPDVRRRAGRADATPRWQGRIEFRRRRGSPTRPGKPTLQHIDLTIEPGQVVAFVGQTGRGANPRSPIWSRASTTRPRERGPRRWLRSAHGHRGVAASADRHRPAGNDLAFLGNAPRQYRLWSPPTRPTPTWKRRPRMPPMPTRSSRACPTATRRLIGERGQDALGRRAAAHRHRPRPSGRPAHPDSGRGDKFAGCLDRGPGAGSLRCADARADDDRDRAPTLDHRRSGPHRRASWGRAHRRDGDARGTAQARRGILPPSTSRSSAPPNSP